MELSPESYRPHSGDSGYCIFQAPFGYRGRLAMMASPNEKQFRINRGSIEYHRPVQMRASRTASSADGANHLALADALADIRHEL